MTTRTRLIVGGMGWKGESADWEDAPGQERGAPGVYRRG